MSHLKSGVLAVLFAVAAGSAFAADDAMKSDAMKMSAHDTKKMASCQAMSHEAMMKSKSCTAMMKAHPDAMKSDAMMKSDGAMSH